MVVVHEDDGRSAHRLISWESHFGASAGGGSIVGVAPANLRALIESCAPRRSSGIVSRSKPAPRSRT